MNTPSYCTTYSDTQAGQRLRQLDEAAAQLLQDVLTSPLITEGQRLKAWETFYATEDWRKRMAMPKAIGKYVRAVQNGERQPRPDVVSVVAVVEEVAHVQPVAVEAVAEVVAEVVQQPVTVEAVAEVAMWVQTAVREALPMGVAWSGRQLPGVGETIVAMRQGRPRRVKVTGYFHAEGFMGVVADFEGRVPGCLVGCHRSRCFFGSEVRLAA